METFHSDLFMNLFAFFSADNASDFNNSAQSISVVLSHLSLSGYAIPLEGAAVGILLFLSTYIMLEHNLQLLSQEKFRLAVGMVRWVHTPLVLLRNSLEDIIRSNTPEDYRALKPLLKHTECIINYSQNVMCLDRAGWKRGIDTLTAEVEIHNYIQMIANQCRSYADLHHIQIEINHSIGHASCKINEVIMTIALQHLLNRMIEKTTPGDCIYLTTSHNTELWQLQISNYQRAEKKSFTASFPIPNLGNLRTVRKIIRLHGGKLITYRCKKSTIFQITVPANCHCPNQTKHIPEIFFPKQADPDRPDRKVPRHYKEKEDIPTTKDIPHILLVMADNRFGDYLKTALSGEFNILLQKKLDIPALTTINKKPDAIIIDENVDGTCGDELCLRIKTEETIAAIPVILLIEYNDNKSYISHAASKADRLEPRTTDIYRLRTDIHMLINSYLFLAKRTNRMLANTTHMLPEAMEKDEDNLIFINKVRELLENNLSTEGYTIDMLCSTMGMSRTVFYHKIKEVTGRPPVEYMLTFKMERAKMLLKSGRHSIAEIADMLGYCDAKYFGRKFKDYYHICPTGYLKKIEQAPAVNS